VAPPGHLALILHAHLPFVRHPEHPRFLEEDWLFEALTETYLPLLDVFEGLVRDRVPLRLTLSLSPTLLSMLTDPLLQQRYRRYLDERIAALAIEEQRATGDAALRTVVQFYHARYRALRSRYLEHDHGDVTGAFRRLADAGQLELITTAATHGYLPLLAANPESLYAQLSMAVRTHQRLLGRHPRGIWLPECAYAPGLDAILAEFGFEYFVLDSHGLLNAAPRPRDGVHRPIRTPAGPAAFGRDFESSREVWAADGGYPGDPLYRDFYRDAGFDVTAEHITRLHHAGQPGYTGLKYHRITGATEAKEPYRPIEARERAAEHAADFLAKRRAQLRHLNTLLDHPPLVVAPYDAELFGHWWFEGPQWIDFLFRGLAADPAGIAAVTPAAWLAAAGALQGAAPPECSWGAGGFHEVWINDRNDWIYPYLHEAAARMAAAVVRFPQASGPARRALDQAARELLLAQASDWAFMLTAGSASAYATRRVKTHLHRFDRCVTMVDNDAVDEPYLDEIASRDNLFPDIDYRIFQRRPWC
jgi:1,4-alpha-glucan branching enzyme